MAARAIQHQRSGGTDALSDAVLVAVQRSNINQTDSSVHANAWSPDRPVLRLPASRRRRPSRRKFRQYTTARLARDPYVDQALSDVLAGMK
jgi:hypothetical protein